MITQAQVNQLMRMNANNLPKEVLPNYQTIKSILDITTDVSELNDLGIEKDFNAFFSGYDKFVPAPKMTTTSTATKTAPKQVASKPATSSASKPTVSAKKGSLAERQAKARFTANTPSGNKTNADKILDKANLQSKVQELYELVKQNARFKNQIGEELTKYLKENVVRLGLGGLPIDYEIEKLKAKVKFYSNLLKNDKDDFKAIAKRLGLSFRDMGKNVQASLQKKGIAVKSATARTEKQKENDAWNWLK